MISLDLSAGARLRLRDPQARAFWALALLLAATFLLGGSARGDAESLIILRPFAALLAGLGIWQLRLEHIQKHKLVLGVALALTALPLLQLVPLPYAIWTSLPGRQQVADIDRIAGLGQIARPISLVPDGTLNALLSLLVPLAALILGIQLGRLARAQLLPVLLGLIGASALLGVLQIVNGPASPLYLYDITNPGSAVGLFANRNHQALLLATSLPMLALWASRDPRSSLLKMVGGAVALLGLIPLILITGSRAGAIAGLVALLTLGLVARCPAPPAAILDATRRRPLRVPKFAGLGVAGLTALALAALTIIVDRAEAWERLQTVFLGDDLRFRIVPTLVQMFPKYWPFGTGLGSFEKIFQAEEPDALLSPVYMNHAHNDWLETALTGGLPAVILLVVAAACAAVSVFRQFLSKSGRSAPNRLARLGLIVVLLTALVSMSDYPLRTPLLQAVFVVAVLWASCPMPQFETLTDSAENQVDIGRNEASEFTYAAPR